MWREGRGGSCSKTSRFVQYCIRNAYAVCGGSQLRMVVLPDLWRVVRSAIGLTYVILLQLSAGVSPEQLKTFWRVGAFSGRRS